MGPQRSLFGVFRGLLSSGPQSEAFTTVKVKQYGAITFVPNLLALSFQMNSVASGFRQDLDDALLPDGRPLEPKLKTALLAIFERRDSTSVHFPWLQSLPFPNAHSFSDDHRL